MFNKKLTLAEAQAQMVKEQLADRQITDRRVLKAMAQIPRHRFVAEKLREVAYQDRPLPIGYGQTISQPYIVAFMTEALRLPLDGQAIVLEVGTGSGYQAAILSQLAARVYSVEWIDALARRAQHILAELGLNNIEIKVSDGGYGWPDYGPYDGIIVAAGAPEIPAPLTVQLKDGGYLIAPVGPKQQQVLLRLQRRGDTIVEEKLSPVAFVPLLGEHGWSD
jgi:protein-L-isoaspartate(D-aspartate) O-methyltransferase